jgi:hypothetical protein
MSEGAFDARSPASARVRRHTVKNPNRQVIMGVEIGRERSLNPQAIKYAPVMASHGPYAADPPGA